MQIFRPHFRCKASIDYQSVWVWSFVDTGGCYLSRLTLHISSIDQLFRSNWPQFCPSSDQFWVPRDQISSPFAHEMINWSSVLGQEVVELRDCLEWQVIIANFGPNFWKALLINLNTIVIIIDNTTVLKFVSLMRPISIGRYQRKWHDETRKIHNNTWSNPQPPHNPFPLDRNGYSPPIPFPAPSTIKQWWFVPDKTITEAVILGDKDGSILVEFFRPWGTIQPLTPIPRPI